MARKQNALRHVITANIRAEREKKYPGRGGSRRCAAAFGVFPQQWSAWERGIWTPDEPRLRQIADHFGVSVEYLCQEQSQPDSTLNSPFPMPSEGEAVIPEVLLYGLACSENENVWQVHKTYSAPANDGQQWHVSLNIVLSKEAEKKKA